MTTTIQEAPRFDAAAYKQATREQWQAAARAWSGWGTFLNEWLGPSTQLMLDLARVESGSRVLDVAAGAGEQTIHAARRAGPSGHVLATDISPAILDEAMQNARRAGLANVSTRTADAEDLGVEPGAYDAAISRLGLIYFPALAQALANVRGALREGGRLAAIVYSTPDRNEFFSIPVSVIRRRAGLPPPAPGQPGPFSLGGEGVLEKQLRDAGFREIEVRRVNAPLRMPSAQECVRFEKESFGALHQMAAKLDAAGKAAAWEEILQSLRRFEGAGGFEGPCELLVAAGTR
ncbi:MAG TPA: class I SAM-dependent methyltransferase [Usitatibacter sp.]|nr:class I SAM-dependent methyltransferase [Usitatibacter sp.]